MNNQNLYKNSDFTKTTGIARFFNFVFLKKIDEAEGRIEGNEFVRADGSKERIQKTNLIEWIFGGWGILCLVCVIFLRKYVVETRDFWLFLDIFFSGITGFAWVLLRDKIAKSTNELSSERSIFFGFLIIVTIFIALVLFEYIGKTENVFKSIGTIYGAIFTTLLFFEIIIVIMRRDYKNYYRLADGTIIFKSPEIFPQKIAFLVISIFVLILGASGIFITESKIAKESKEKELRIARFEKEIALSRLKKQAEDNGSAYILYTYTKIQPQNDREAKVNALLKIDLGMDKKTDVIYPWDKNYPGYGGKFSQVIR